MKLVVVGGGGFRVPLVHGKLLADPDGLVDELVLHDVDERRLRAIAAVLEQQAAGSARRPRLRTTTDLDAALGGADVVFTAIRAGGLAGRAADERIALSEGLLGQETVGPGGLCYALRTVPVAVDVARRVAELAPRAWLVNFTNPAGAVTEAMSAVLGDRVLGICDSPAGLCRRVADALGVRGAWFDYVGINHLGWLRRVLVDGRDVLADLLADDAALAGFEEGRLFSPEWLRTIGAVPNEYLHFYYSAREAVAELAGGERTRGEFLRQQQEAFYRRVDEDPSAALETWRQVRQQREQTYFAEARAVAGAGGRDSCDLDSGGYEDVALRVLSSLAHDSGSTTILNVRNRGAVPGLDRDAVVEVPCLVDGNGAHPVAAAAPEPHFAALLGAVKAAERDAVAAALQRSRRLALRAMAAHPLVDSVAAATRVLDGYAAAFPELSDFAR